MILAALVAASAVAAPLDWSPPSCDEVYPEGDQFEVFLVTMVPGDETFSFVGHTAAWVRKPGRFDRIFNFGTISSTRQEPASALMLGTLECWWTTRSKDREIRRYVKRRRTMVAQRIDLPDPEERAFFDALRDRARGREAPEVFHWYDNNCATGIRDTLNVALDGYIEQQLSQDHPMTARQEVLRHLGPSVPAWFGWHFIAGSWADQTIDRYDAAFIPERLAEALGDVDYTWPDGERRPLLGPSCSLYQGELAPASASPPSRGLAALAVGLVLGTVTVVLGRTQAAPARWALGALVALLGLVAGLAGTISLLLWQLSALDGLGPNENWFVASPLAFLLIPFGLRLARRKPTTRFWRRATALIGGLALVGLLLQPVLPQDNLEIMAVFTPLLLAVALIARTTGPQQQPEPATRS